YTCVDAGASTPADPGDGGSPSPGDTPGEPSFATASPRPVTRTFQVTLVGPATEVTAGQGVEVTWRVDPGGTPVALEETISPGVLTMRGTLRWVELPGATPPPEPTGASPSPTASGDPSP